MAEGAPRNHTLLKLVLLGSLLLLLAVGVYKTGIFQFFLTRERIKEFLDSLGPLSFLGFILLQSFQVIVAAIPGEATGLLGGYLYGPALGVLLSTIGLTLGSWLAFTLSRKLGRPFVEKMVRKETMDRFDYLLHHKGAFLAFMLFLLPGFPKDYLCYILGLGHLTTREFLIISGSGRLLGTTILTLGGSFIRNRQYNYLFILVGITILIIFFALAYNDRIEKCFKALHKPKKARH